MNTSKMWPETIVSGFFYLVGLSFWLACLLDLNQDQLSDLFCRVGSVNGGEVGLISALILGGSYMFGHIGGRLMVDLFQFLKGPCSFLQNMLSKDKQPSEDDELFVRLMAANQSGLADALHNRWVAMYFYRSIIGGILFLGVTSARWWTDCSNPRLSCAVWILGLALEGAFIIAFFTQRESYLALRRTVGCRRWPREI